jgi:hypothetical protein
VITEYMQSVERAGGPPVNTWLVAAWGWGVLLVGWFGAATAAPLHDDNRPWKNAREFDVEHDLVGGAK